jgi:hypothetical protein
MRTKAFSPSVLACTAVSAAALVLSPALSRPAQACGGFWCSQTAPVNQSAEQILFVDNPDSTVTAVIQISYVGPSTKFAWVIPIPGNPKVEVSSNTAFQRLDTATAPEYNLEVHVQGMCLPNTFPQYAAADSVGLAGGTAAPPTAKSAVMVIAEGSVGPYDYTVINVDPMAKDPADVATKWFTANGYDLTSLDSKVLSPYLADGLNLLAFKLTKGQQTGAIRPVMLTYDSKLPMIPIRPTAVAAQDDMGIKVWVAGPKQAVPENYKSLVINEALINWFSYQQNYDQVVTAAANEAGGQGFVTELAGPSAKYKDLVFSAMDKAQLQMLSSMTYASGIDAIFMANNYYRGWDGWKEAIAGATTLPAGVSIDDFGRNPDMYRGTAQVDTAKFFQLLDEKVVKPVADTAALVATVPYLTRLYSTMSSDEMTVDPAFTYNGDLADVSNIHTAKQYIQCSPKIAQYDAPWRIELPQGGVIVGTGGQGGYDWPVAEGSMPANLKIVMLSTSGSGKVVTDNSGMIGTMLFKTAGMMASPAAMAPPPKTGVMIGGDQKVTLKDMPTSTSNPTSMGAGSGSSCAVSAVGASRGAWLALLLPAWVLALRRRRSQ